MVSSNNPGINSDGLPDSTQGSPNNEYTESNTVADNESTQSSDAEQINGLSNSNGISQSGPRAQSITILHFNDVYNVEEQAAEPKAGAARFKTALQSFSDRQPLVFFCGDILAPSIMSTVTKGEQMVTVMKHLGIHCAVYGNHDFDFGLDRLLDVKSRTDFPWLMSNVDDNETGRPLGDGQRTHIIHWHGWNIGLIGLVESEWLETLSTINPEQVTYVDYVDKARELAYQLRCQGCDYIIALTHMRTPNDLRLAENADEIDLILGGHDHDYELIKVNGKILLKSGTDFREFSTVTLTQDGSKVSVDIEKVIVDSRFEPDKKLQEELAPFEGMLSENMDEVLGNVSLDLDGRFSKIRTSETNLGNLICDVMLACTNSDLAILNAGSMRSDRIHAAGNFTVRDLMTVLPMIDPLIVIQVTGKEVIEALENGVSQYPKLVGRFPQVSGIEFLFDASAPAGSRIIRDLVKIGDEYLDPCTNYRLVTKAYLQQGRDGYTVFRDCKVLQDDEQCPMLSTSVQNHFEAIKSRRGKARRNSTHRQSLVLLSRRHSLIKCDALEAAAEMKNSLSDTCLSLTDPKEMKNSSSDQCLSLNYPSLCNSTKNNTPDDLSPEDPAHTTDLQDMPPKRSLDSLQKPLTKPLSRKLSRSVLIKKDSVTNLEEIACKLEPQIEGRIRLATKELVTSLRTRKVSRSAISEEDESISIEC